MMLFLTLLAGFVLLVAGGELAIKGAVALAKNLGLPKAVIGLTVIAYGTSMPELVVSLESALTGHADLALGNVIGSNISNILLVLGATALVCPILMDRNLLAPDGWITLAVAALLLLFCLDGAIGRAEGWIFIAVSIGYTAYVFYQGRKKGFEELEQELEDALKVDMPLTRSAPLVIGGIVLMVAGGTVLVEGGVELATRLGVSEGVIGLTIIAVGTSLPELAASIAAARRRHADIAVANVLGSNMLNIFGIVGITAAIQPLDVDPSFLAFDLWLMLGLTVLLVLMLARGMRLTRLFGMVFTAGFIGYILYQYQSLVL